MIGIPVDVESDVEDIVPTEDDDIGTRVVMMAVVGAIDVVDVAPIQCRKRIACV